MIKALDSVWGALQMAFHIALGPFLHGRRTRWGATDAEVHQHVTAFRREPDDKPSDHSGSPEDEHSHSP